VVLYHWVLLLMVTASGWRAMRRCISVLSVAPLPPI
jgi:hypothetical protein